MLVNVVLFTFNALPIPPLDGFGVLESLAPASLMPLVAAARPLGWVLLLVLIASGVMTYVLLPGYFAALLLNVLVALMTGWA